MLENLLFGLEAIAPIFSIIIVGWFLYRINIINDNFVDVSSKLVMNVTFPILLILKISDLNIQQQFEINHIALYYFVFIFITLFSYFVTRIAGVSDKERGAFIQATYRGNFGIIGLALCANLFGKEGLSIAALFLAFLIPLYNVLSVTVLSNNKNENGQFQPLSFIKKVILNPLIIGIIIGSVLALLGIKIPEAIARPANYLASITLPLALLGIGATMKFKNRNYSMKNAMLASIIKLLILPVLGVSLAILLGVKGMQLGVLFILFSVPTAIVTMPLAKSMGGDDKLAGAIVVFSSVGSVVTIALGLSFLRQFGLI